MYKRWGMNESMDPERIDEIAQLSIPFPFFLNTGGDVEEISQAMYVEELGPNSPLMMPSYITLVKEGADGWSTIGTYELVETIKEHPIIEPDKLN